MNLTHVPLLQTQRDLYDLPRSPARFQAYLDTMRTADGSDIELPLPAMNPMAKEHVPQMLDDLLAMEADAVAAETVSQVSAAQGWVDAPGDSSDFRVALVLSDDLLGGWTNRYVYEFNHRFREQALHKRGWATTLLWTSETYTPEIVREAVAATLHRLAHIQRHGYAHTLRDMLAQEGHAMTQAGATAPSLDADDLAYTREVLADYLDAEHEPILLPALFGDPAAHELGYTPLGLSSRAGLALALHDALVK